MRLQNPVDIIILIVACEALVQLWLHAAPLYGVRWRLIRYTPFLYSEERAEHLLNCPYCFSVWVGFLLILGYFFLNSATMLIAGILTVHRLSNYLHLVFSLIRDAQLDLRVKRNK
jgi:hypothetical protein